jgi:hypothetical protein
MSLTSYRAAPPRENGKRGTGPARNGYVAIMTRIEKGCVRAAAPEAGKSGDASFGGVGGRPAWAHAAARLAKTGKTGFGRSSLQTHFHRIFT